VQEIIPTGANDVYVIRPTDGREADEILVPAIASVVLDIDVPNRRMVVELPEGLV
jgi:16S rRNA processing protein RimM